MVCALRRAPIPAHIDEFLRVAMCSPVVQVRLWLLTLQLMQPCAVTECCFVHGTNPVHTEQNPNLHTALPPLLTCTVLPVSSHMSFSATLTLI